MPTRNRNSVTVDKGLLLRERTRRNWHQAAMAEYLGVTLATYKRAEAGTAIDATGAIKVAQKLGLTLEELVPQTFAPDRYDTRAYLEDLHAECSTINVRGLTVGGGNTHALPIEDVYVPLAAGGGGPNELASGRQKTPGRHAKSGESPAATLEDRIDAANLVVIGDPGGGKTTFLRRVAWENSGRGGRRFPVLIRIGQFEDFIHSCVHGGAIADPPAPDSADWLPRYLAHCSEKSHWGLDAAFFRAKLRERTALILMDGLDEVPNVTRRESMTRLFENATQAYRDARFVVTTRPAAYEGRATLAGFDEVRIGKLDSEAKERFLRQWAQCLNRSDSRLANRLFQELTTALKARPDIQDMASNPLMLTAIAAIYWNDNPDNAVSKRLPDNRADLYASILKWLAEAKSHLPRPNPQTCLSYLAVLAFEMQCYPGGRIKLIGKNDAAALIRNEFRHKKTEAERHDAALAFLEGELIASGIIVSRGEFLEFWHLTFMEYLAAYICSGREPAKFLFESDRWLLPEWREVVLLVPGIISADRYRVDLVFNAALNRAESPSATLALKARAAGLLGSALRDLHVFDYQPPDPVRFAALKTESGRIFEKHAADAIPLEVRVEAAEALGQGGDQRLDRDSWVAIPAGTFLMGAQKTRKGKPGYDEEAFESDGPVREVSVGGFRMGRYPVTVQEFGRFVDDEENGYGTATHWPKDSFQGEPAPPDWDEQILHLNRPAVNVSWFAATAYCNWAGLRLPTEAEWEYAARGTEGRKYPWGNEPPDANRANYSDSNVGAPTPVGLFPNGATPEGLDDMAGNVFEWTNSWFDEKKKDSLVLRGGCWINISRYLRAAYRGRSVPGVRDNLVGFRVVREA